MDQLYCKTRTDTHTQLDTQTTSPRRSCTRDARAHTCGSGTPGSDEHSSAGGTPAATQRRRLRPAATPLRRPDSGNVSGAGGAAGEGGGAARGAAAAAAEAAAAAAAAAVAAATRDGCPRLYAGRRWGRGHSTKRLKMPAH